MLVSMTLFIGSSLCLLGAIFGSGVTALSWRLPRGESWVHGHEGVSGAAGQESLGAASGQPAKGGEGVTLA